MNEKGKEAMIKAVVSGTLIEFEKAFTSNTLVFDDSYFDYKLLQAGLRRKNYSILQYLINKVECRAGNPKKVKAEKTPLHLAMKLNNESYVKKMLNRGALVFDKDNNGEIALLTGFKSGNFSAVRALLTHCKPKCEPGNKDALLHFHIACATNHISAAEYYLECGINPNIPLSIDSEEYSDLNPVQLAAQKNYYELFQKLLHYGADLSIKNAKNETPMHIIYYTSPTQEKISRIQYIFENGNDTKFVNVVDKNRVSHFHLCCMLNKPGYVKKFIDNSVNVNSSISRRCTIDQHFTALHFAVDNGCEKTVKLLLKNDADCNKKDIKGRTPLHFAHKISGYWKEPTYKMLLDHKAKPNIADTEGCTPLHMEFLNTRNSDNKNILDMLFSKISSKTKNITDYEGLSLFHIACATNNISKVKSFLRSDGVQVDSCVSLGVYSGYTALHFAVLNNHIDVVNLLLKKNAQVNIKTKEFQVTPLHLACQFNYSKFREGNFNQNLEDFKSFPINLDSLYNYTNQIDIITLLLSHGAQVDAKDYQGMTPLLRACIIERSYCKLKWSYNSQTLSRQEKVNLIKNINARLKEIIEILLRKKANVAACSNKQETVLHIISKCNSLTLPESLIKLILAKGAKIDAVDNFGLTPLHTAIKADNNRMAKMLLRNKANVNIKCQDLNSPLSSVFKKLLNYNRREKDMFCAMLENGGDVNIKGEKDSVLLFDAINSFDDFLIAILFHYGADINIEDSLGNSCISSILFKWMEPDITVIDRYEYFNVFEIIYVHVQKLLALGLHVSKKILNYCKRFYIYYENENHYDTKVLNSFHNCTKELERMKLIKMDNYTSLYSVLLKDEQELSKHVKNKNFIKTIKARDLSKDFPLYSYLLQLQLKKGLIRSEMMESARTSLTNIVDVNLPELCFDWIMKYLKNEDVANMVAAAPVRRAMKRRLENNSANIQNENEENPREKRLRLRNSSKIG